MNPSLHLTTVSYASKLHQKVKLWMKLCLELRHKASGILFWAFRAKVLLSFMARHGATLAGGSSAPVAKGAVFFCSKASKTSKMRQVR